MTEKNEQNNEPIDITKLSTEKLESLAYKLVIQISGSQQNLNLIQQELTNREEKGKEK